MANQGINYDSRNFVDIRTDLINMVRQYYPDIFNDFNDASVSNNKSTELFPVVFTRPPPKKYLHSKDRCTDLF
jgi:hypothetical protein